MGLRVLISHSAEMPVNCPEEMVCGVPCSSGIEFAVGRSASKEEAFGASHVLPGKFRQVSTVSVLRFGKLGTI